MSNQNQNSTTPEDASKATKLKPLQTDSLDDQRRSQMLPFRKSPLRRSGTNVSPLGSRFNRMSADATNPKMFGR